MNATEKQTATPGPWRVELSSNQFETSGFVCSIVGHCDPGPDGLGDDVARVATHYDGPAMFTRARWEANARLIAAAPRMYDRIARLAAEGDAEALAILEDVHGRS